MKVVINDCYGGFGLSPLAIKEYLKLKGKDVFFYKQIKYSYRDGESLYKKVEPNDRDFLLHAVTKDLGDSFNNFPEGEEIYFYDRGIERNDPDLVKVIEMLGKKASDEYADLKIVEIPDGINWEISEYDGMEHVAEKHHTWC